MILKSTIVKEIHKKLRPHITPPPPSTKPIGHWNAFHIRNSVLYKKLEYDDRKSMKWRLLIQRSRILDALNIA